MKAFLQSAARISAGVLFGVFVVLSLISMLQEKLIFFQGGPHSLVTIEGADHNAIRDSVLYWEAIQNFLQAL